MTHTRTHARTNSLVSTLWLASHQSYGPAGQYALPIRLTTRTPPFPLPPLYEDSPNPLVVIISPPRITNSKAGWQATVGLGAVDMALECATASQGPLNIG